MILADFFTESYFFRNTATARSRMRQGVPETDFSEDLKKIEVPALVLHGEDDQIVPVIATGRPRHLPIAASHG